MIIDARNTKEADPRAAKGVRGMLVDADTGKPIRFARWANIETGEWEAWQTTPDGSRISHPPTLLKGKCRLQFVESYAPVVGDPIGVDTRAALEERAEYRRKTEPRLMIMGEYCEMKGCRRLAQWRVGWDRLLTPVRQPDGSLHEHHVLVRIMNLCSFCYRSPVQINQRGVETEIALDQRPG